MLEIGSLIKMQNLDGRPYDFFDIFAKNNVVSEKPRIKLKLVLCLKIRNYCKRLEN